MDEKIDIKKMLEENNIKVRKEQQVDTNMEHTLGRAPDPSLINDEYSTGGVEVDTDELMKGRPNMVEGVTLPTINKDQKANIESYLSEMNEDIEAAKKRLENTGEYTSVADLFVNDETGLVVKEEPKPEDDPDAIIVEEEIEPKVESKDDFQKENKVENEEIPYKKNQEKDEKIELEDEENIDDDILEKEVDNKKEEEIKTTEDLKRKYEEAIVIIDKSGMGHVDFTDEERKKLEHVKKIKVEEVETVSLKTIRRKKVKKGSSDAIIKKINSVKETTIVLP